VASVSASAGSQNLNQAAKFLIEEVMRAIKLKEILTSKEELQIEPEIKDSKEHVAKFYELCISNMKYFIEDDASSRVIRNAYTLVPEVLRKVCKLIKFIRVFDTSEPNP
jgi:hypothetical protein